MAFIGDVIIRARKAFPDYCQTLLQPPPPTLTGATASGTLPLLSLVVAKLSWLTNWGETISSIEAGVTLTGTQNTVNVLATPPPGATKGRLYIGSAAGNENQWIDITSGTATILNMTSGIPGFPNAINRAYLPDTDGNAVSAQDVFLWLNQALEKMGQASGGVWDEGGVAWLQGSGEAVLMGRWLSIDTMWWDGWWIPQGRPQSTWLRGLLTSIPGLVASWGNSETGQVLGQWPQPSSTAAATTTTAPIGQTDTSFSVANSSNFRAPGLALIDQEIFNFSSIDTGISFGLLTRGEGGTRATTHLSGATVNQLIARFVGYRLEPTYHVGDSGLSLQVPPAWTVPLDLYMLARMKQFEQDYQAATALDQQFAAELPKLRANRGGPIGPNQLGSMTPLSSDFEQLASLAGGILIQ